MVLSGKPDISQLEEKKDVDGLMKALESENAESIRESAAAALGRIGDPRAVEALMAALINDLNVNAIDALAEIGDTRAVEPLIDFLKSGRYLFRVAKALIKLGDAEVRDQVFAVLRAKGGRILTDVANDGSAEDVEFLIKAGVDVDTKTSGGYTPLLIAAGRGRTRIVKMLLDAGADVNARGESNRSAYDLACDRDYAETAQLIREYIDMRDL